MKKRNLPRLIRFSTPTRNIRVAARLLRHNGPSHETNNSESRNCKPRPSHDLYEIKWQCKDQSYSNGGLIGSCTLSKPCEEK